ncbi:Transcriptional corepressor LEUNIG [Acorus calamus]|uniref:Transcriptional corepressor LEUNIG n=1 Tax=Acorus calamus TaxID=4465 RepID=A0AAV9E4K1_ACOCL|nr:Transcriptional corepressor LEUNIG [Acorus calamus]
MAQRSNWEAEKMLDVYIHDYLLKKNLQSTAKAFMDEGKVSSDPVAIDAPGGFLYEWWSVFWDIFIARTNEKHSEVAAAYIEMQQIKAREQRQQLQMQQQLQFVQQHGQIQKRDGSYQSLGGAIDSDGILGGPSPASVLAAKLYDGRVKYPQSLDSNLSPQLDASRMSLLKSANNHPGQLVQGNHGSVSLQQIQAQAQQSTDILSDANSGLSQRCLPMNTSIYAQGVMQPLGSSPAGMNQGVSSLHMKGGWPLTGIDQLRPSFSPQVHRPFLQAPNQSQMLIPQRQQQLFAQAQVQGNLGSPSQSTSPNVGVTSQDQTEIIMKMKLAHMQQSSAQQQQQLQQNNRKRKQSASGAANSTGTGNTIGPSISPPSTPSIHTSGDGGALGGGLQQVNNMPKSLMMYSTDGAGGLVSSSNQLDDMENFGDVSSLDNVESILSHDDGEMRDVFSAFKRSPTDHKTDHSKSFTFQEVGRICTSNSKVVCCHFSSDGKLLASAGHEKKVVLWNMDTLKTESTPEGHALIITDIRFRPSSTQLATSSFDRTVRLWDAAKPDYLVKTYSGHNFPVMSLDFHPKKTDLFCSCDGNGEMRYWNINQLSCTRISKGGTAQVRFQPRIGQYLAAAADNMVSVFDVETDRKSYTLQGHGKEVHSVCWDANGEYLASVSQDSVRVWSIRNGDLVHELSSNGNKFHSCIFHPTYSNLLIIGGYQSLELWNMTENKCMTVQAHDGLIAALAQSPVSGMVASASHDTSVKLWR